MTIPRSKSAARRLAWSAPTTDDEARRRAAGRRRYNAMRQVRAALRQRLVAMLISQWGWHRGVGRRLARALDVAPSTISSDLRRLRQVADPCPCCGSIVLREMPDATVAVVGELLLTPSGDGSSAAEQAIIP